MHKNTLFSNQLKTMEKFELKSTNAINATTMNMMGDILDNISQSIKIQIRRGIGDDISNSIWQNLWANTWEIIEKNTKRDSISLHARQNIIKQIKIYEEV